MVLIMRPGLIHYHVYLFKLNLKIQETLTLLDKNVDKHLQSRVFIRVITFGFQLTVQLEVLGWIKFTFCSEWWSPAQDQSGTNLILANRETKLLGVHVQKNWSWSRQRIQIKVARVFKREFTVNCLLLILLLLLGCILLLYFALLFRSIVSKYQRQTS